MLSPYIVVKLSPPCTPASVPSLHPICTEAAFASQNFVFPLQSVSPLPCGSDGNESSCSGRHLGSISGLGSSPAAELYICFSQSGLHATIIFFNMVSVTPTISLHHPHSLSHLPRVLRHPPTPDHVVTLRNDLYIHSFILFLPIFLPWCLAYNKYSTNNICEWIS